MPNWPRTINPAEVSGLHVAGPLLSQGQSGKIQRRSAAEKGRWWTELFAGLSMNNEDVKEFLALIAYYWNTGLSFDIGHLDYATPNGAGGGTPKVKVANQTGDAINTDGWPNDTLVLKAGDIFSIASMPRIYQVREDATSDGSGNATIKLVQPIESGASPGDNADLTITAVVFTCILVEPPNLPDSGPDDIIVGLSLTFREDL